MSQAPEKRATFDSIILAPAFALGFQAGQDAHSWPPDYDEWTTALQWHYERGRLFALAAPHITQLTVKISPRKFRVHPDAYAAFSQAYKARIIL